MIKGRPPRLSQIFQSYDAPLFLVTVCTLHRRKIPSLKAAQEALVVYGTRAISESMSRSADMLLCLTICISSFAAIKTLSLVTGEGTQASDIEGLSERKRSLPTAARFFRSPIA